MKNYTVLEISSMLGINVYMVRDWIIKARKKTGLKPICARKKPARFTIEEIFDIIDGGMGKGSSDSCREYYKKYGIFSY
jgi:hypothetical protein